MTTITISIIVIIANASSTIIDANMIVIAIMTGAIIL